MGEESEYIAISQLFDVIGIIEKGIEKIYHHLLKNNRIENLEEVSKQYKLTLKRGYKICAVLNNLELVQIFDRPMKIHLNPDLIPIWQKLIVKRIEELNIKFQEKKDKCESALVAFFQTYNVKEVVQSQEPVEFINYNIEHFDDMYYPFLAKNECKIAIGIQYENPLLSIIKADMLSDPPKDKKPFLVAGMKKVQENLKNIDVQVIFHGELARYFLTSKELEILSDHLGKLDPPLEFKSFEAHITEEPFSNFSLTDDALIQPSFDPTNKLIGAYISRNKNIFPIFYDKFNEIFNNGVPINDFIKNERDINILSLSNEQLLAMCLL